VVAKYLYCIYIQLLVLAFSFANPSRFEWNICSFVVGGFIGDRLLTREGLIQYSQLLTLSGLHVQFGQLLMQTTAQTQHFLTSHQMLLAHNLDYHCSKHSQPWLVLLFFLNLDHYKHWSITCRDSLTVVKVCKVRRGNILSLPPMPLSLLPSLRYRPISLCPVLLLSPWPTLGIMGSIVSSPSVWYRGKLRPPIILLLFVC